MKLTMPMAVFCGMTFIAAAIYFGSGSQADAEVADMDVASLATDKDFTQAVLDLVERHCVVHSSGAGTLDANFDKPVDCRLLAPTL